MSNLAPVLQSNRLSILVTKDPMSASIHLYQANPKIAHEYINLHSRSCSAYLETIADIDEAHLMTMYEMRDLIAQLYGVPSYNLPRQDRLVAAKALAEALLRKSAELPLLGNIEVEVNHNNRKYFPPKGNVVSPPKKGTKMAIFIELVAKGTTLEELCLATGWKVASIYSGFNSDLTTVRGFGYTVEKKDGLDFFNLIIPGHYHGPLVQ